MEVKPNERLKPSELQLPYDKFEKMSRQRSLDTETQEWLSEWRMYDLHMSPIDDDTRKILRYGHYQGWFAHKRSIYDREFPSKWF